MTGSQMLIFGVLGAIILLFAWGRWRYDLVAFGGLLVVVLGGLIPAEAAFDGFGHPAVISVAAVLVLSHGLQITGAVDALAKRILPGNPGPVGGILTLTALAAALSGFMNNVGALALLMPIALQLASRIGLPPGKMLMPLSFASILGGTTTLIGTPPNLIVSGFRAGHGGEGFAMFDFAPVGVPLALGGVLLIGLAGWRLVPARDRADRASFESGNYFSEVRIVEGSKAIGKRLREVEQMLDEADAQIVGMVRSNVRLSAPNPRRVLREDDILIIEVDPKSLSTVLSSLGAKLEEAVAPEDSAKEEAKKAGKNAPADGAPQEGTPEEQEGEEESARSKPDEVVLQELVVMPNAAAVNRSATAMELRTRHGINLLAISRQGTRRMQRLRTTPLAAGDVLLMQGPSEAIVGFAALFGCLPLASRDIWVPQKKQAIVASAVMAGAVAVSALGLAPAAVAFTAAALIFVGTGVVPLRSLYTAIDWPVIVLLGAMLPVAAAMEQTGAAGLIAGFLMDHVAQGNAIAALVALLIATMLLSDVMNNAATAAVMCPIALSAAQQLGVNSDAFLMAIAVGASCTFLTPIGHQNNTLILGPGGFHFGDYWRMGILVDVLVIAVGVPLLLWAWPLYV